MRGANQPEVAYQNRGERERQGGREVEIGLMRRSLRNRVIGRELFFFGKVDDTLRKNLTKIALVVSTTPLETHIPKTALLVNSLFRLYLS